MQERLYRRLIQFADFFADWDLLPFTDRAAETFQGMRKQKVRISSTDLKIAVIALDYDGTLLTRNVAYFKKVPGLRFENWLA